MNNSYKKAKEEFESGLLCAESVLKIIGEEQGIKSDLIPRMASGFCSGMARTSNMCGAVTGGIIALSLLFGRNTADESLDGCYSAVQTLIDEFEKEFGSSNCKALLNCDLGTDEGQQIFADNELMKQCGHFVGKAAEMTKAIIEK